MPADPTPAARAYVGLGSNLADPVAQLRRALARLAELPASRLLAHSSLYASAPMGPADQPDYVNAVAKLETRLAPLELLAALQGVENDQGRTRGVERWGPRTLDLDLLLYDDIRLDSPTLTVPHPGLTERAFVVVPLLELDPGLTLPDGRALADIAATLDCRALSRLEHAA